MPKQTSLTLSVDEVVLRQARMRALREGSSVNDKVRDFLAAYAQGGQSQQSAAQAFIEAARLSQANSGGPAWHRDEAHDRPGPGRG
jgi:hypothetical protein